MSKKESNIKPEGLKLPDISKLAGPFDKHSIEKNTILRVIDKIHKLQGECGKCNKVKCKHEDSTSWLPDTLNTDIVMGILFDML